MVDSSPAKFMQRAKGGYRLGVSLDLRSPDYEGVGEGEGEMAFFSFYKTTKENA